MKQKRTSNRISAKNAFTITLVVVGLTVLAVYLFGLGQHHTFYQNSMISTTVLSVAFFVFITVGLYKGIRLKDDVGNMIDARRPLVDTYVPTSNFEPINVDLDMDGDEGFGGIIFSILLWILTAVVLAFVLWILGDVVVVAVLAFLAMLYWIFLRALRLVFRNSNKSKGDLVESVKLGLMYTVLYNFWIYGVFMITHYLKA